MAHPAAFPLRPLPATLSLADALEATLDELERVVDPPASPTGDAPPRFETGVGPLDRVLGGVPRGGVTVVATDRPVVTEILAVGVGRGCPHPCVLAVPDAVALTRSVLGAQARVPVALIEAAVLSEADWDALVQAITDLVTRPVSITTASGRTLVADAVRTVDAALVVVVEPDRFARGPLGWRVVLERLARDLGVAVVVLTDTEPTVGDAPAADVVAVGTDRFTGGLLVASADPGDLIRRETVGADPLTRTLGA